MASRRKTDLKECKTSRVDGRINHGIVSGAVTVVLRNLQRTLIRLIDGRQSGFIFMAMAWVSSSAVVEALHRAKRRGVLVLVIVTKEAYLAHPRQDWQKRLVEQYTLLGTYTSLPRFQLQQVQAVRCVGTRTSNQARMHDKFVVFGDADAEMVWTGSYNCSQVAEDSFENAVILRDPASAAAYYKEFTTLLLLSEPIDSPHRVMHPSWRQ